jgi:hypothetical protein
LFIADYEDPEVVSFLNELKGDSKAAGTKDQYLSAWSKFAEWSLMYNHRTLPAKSRSVDLYVAFAIKNEKGIAFAQMALAAIADMHVRHGFATPTNNPTIKMTMQGVKKRLGKPATQAKGFTKGLVKGLVRKWIGKDLDSGGRVVASKVSWREAWRELTCFVSTSRVSDLQKLARKAVVIDENQGCGILHFRTRKNDPTHRGFVSYIFANPWSRYCPVRLTRRYMRKLPSHPDTPMLPDLAKQRAHLRPVNYQASRTQQKSMLRALGCNPRPYGLHSSRIGGNKELENKKMSVEDRNAVSGWAMGSEMPGLYAQAAMVKWFQKAGFLNM